MPSRFFNGSCTPLLRSASWGSFNSSRTGKNQPRNTPALRGYHTKSWEAMPTVTSGLKSFPACFLPS